MIYAQKKLFLENETRKIHKDFDIQTDHLIPATRPDLVIVNKKKKKKKKRTYLVDVGVSDDQRWKIKGGKKKRKMSI